ncbi:MAG TPA: TRAM domain-containing protein [Phycisphaerales bacterium]|nr:TRAM domain-containing protein [Phycisphaerales bacterium]
MPPPEQAASLHPFEAAQRQRASLLRIVRMGFIVMVVTVTLLSIIEIDQNQFSLIPVGWWLPLLAAAGLVTLVIILDFLTPNKKISTISGMFLGLLAGMVATYALGFIIDLIASTYDIQDSPLVSTVKVLLGISLCYLGITTVLHTQDDFRLVIPYVEFAKQIRGPKPLLLDSSALIDARIVDLAGTGLIQAPIIIPRFVVGELQVMADSSDRLLRFKGRRGLDMIARLQRSGHLDITLDDTPVPGKAVDQMLVELSRLLPGTIVTTDTGLARVAQIQGVHILNINDVAAALRPALVPGEEVRVRLVKRGEQPGQGVGYLPDGTMIVVEGGAEHVGLEVQAEVVSSLQTSAGRLLFARPAGEAATQQAQPQPPASPTPAMPAGTPTRPPEPPAEGLGTGPAASPPAAGAAHPPEAEADPSLPQPRAHNSPRASPRPTRLGPGSARNPRRL